MTGGRTASWLGANFWSRTGGPLMWRRYDPAVISAELRVLREHGALTTLDDEEPVEDVTIGPFGIKVSKVAQGRAMEINR